MKIIRDMPGFGFWFIAALMGGSFLLNGVIVYFLPYGLWIEAAVVLFALIDRAAFNGEGRPFRAYRRARLWEDCRAYFPLTLRQEEDLSPDQAYLFGCFPHGILGFCMWMTFGADATQLSRKNRDLDVSMATVGSNFYIPFWRDLLLATGFLDASFKSLQTALRLKRSVAIVVGGAAESLNAHPGTNDIVLNRRTGFVRLALSTGTPLVPVFMFGENDLFHQFPNPQGSLVRRFQEWSRNLFKVATPIILGTGAFGFPFGILPRKIPMLGVIGKPIPVPLRPTPTDAEVRKYHTIYREALEQLYAKHAPYYYEQVLPPAMRPKVQPKLRIVA